MVQEQKYSHNTALGSAMQNKSYVTVNLLTQGNHAGDTITPPLTCHPKMSLRRRYPESGLISIHYLHVFLPNFYLWLSRVGFPVHAYTQKKNPHSSKDTKLATPLGFCRAMLVNRYLLTLRHVKRHVANM